MKKAFILALLVLFAVPAIGVAQEDIIKKGEQLNLQRCVEIALRKQPSIVAARNTVDVNRSRVGQAQSNYYPQISADASYKRVKPLTGAQRALTTGVDGTSPSSATAAFDDYTGSLSVNQLIFDFWKTKNQVDIQKLNVGASRSDLENTAESVVFDVKQTYYGVLQAKRNRDVAEETVRQFQQHLEQAKGFYQVGTAAKYDVTKAEVDLSNSKLNLIKADNALKIARVNLNNAMGVPDAPEYGIEDNLSYSKYQISFDEALERAYQNRPDLQSLIFQRKATEQSIDLAKKDYYPVLTGSASYTRQGQDFPLQKGWNAGVNLTFPIFSGFLTKNQVAEQKANLEVVRANEESLKQNILLDVQQGYLNLAQAAESITTAELTVKQATENLEIANGRYAAGVGNPIEVTDAEVSLTNAKTSYIQALYDYKVAVATIEKAMGVRYQ
ncbi:MAG: TolC family protein [Candidatus Sulfobium sp.]|jgi:outer membrane protein